MCLACAIDPVAILSCPDHTADYLRQLYLFRELDDQRLEALTAHSHAIELEGWEEDRGEVETPRQAVPLPERPFTRPSRPVMPPPVLQPVAMSAECDHEVDAMPEAVFENLHASFSSSGPATTPEPLEAPDETPPAPRPLPPMCECRKCPTCVRRRHLWRIVHTLDDEPVVAHVTE